MQLPVCYNPNITKWPNIGTVFWATVAADCHPRASENQESDFMHLIYALDDGLKPPCNLQSLWWILGTLGS